jgi:GntR family transcriptional regulator
MAKRTHRPAPKSTVLDGDSPLFAQLKDRLRQDILEHRLQPGQKLPSESQLQSTYGVSRITVRQALAELQADGLIETFNGKGSFVTRPGETPNLGMLTGFYEYMRARGWSARGEILSVKTVAASQQAAKALHVAAKSSLTRITLVRFVNEAPVAVGRFEFEHALAERLLALNMETEDTMTLLETQLGHRLESIHFEASALPAKATEARLLQVPAGTPLLRIVFVPHDIEDRPLAYAVMHFRADRFSYRAVIRR